MIIISVSANPGQAQKPIYRLAPAFDQLPMFFMPVAGQILTGDFQAPVPRASQIEVWEEAKSLANEFWVLVKKDKRISRNFRTIAGKIDLK